ncbi:septal ring lytic transglycosylase RlpA family protein [Aureimonas altamirensis]|uniref:septal ring lytic transglycosylase RlpA family protein n=1 Tax=Aureimonas altamirensis TaxID=370622 RepID=UPI0020368515|nr:septal ring lytic transglycosylase RlpA family protein [Aureimonas altamirensis]MCM2504451.1 septal ring lytic transglycosylase RlpA family protein [Aureimonas altamirensis]
MKMTADASRARVAPVVIAVCATAFLAACQSGSSTHAELAPEPDAPAFTSAEYGVEASPRVSNLKQVRKGGGRDHVGKPYKVKGKWYYPKEDENYEKAGKASWYGANFHGRLTANGEVYDMYHLSAAHPTFPLPSYARVTNKSNGNSVLVRVNDRGPFSHNRIVDVSSKAADVLGFKSAGIADVKVEYVGRAPVDGDDTPMLMASFRPGGQGGEQDGLPQGVMVASAERPSDEMLVAAAFASAGHDTPAISAAAGSGVPGVRSMQAIQQVTAAERAARSEGFAMPVAAPAPSAPAFAPMPTPRSGMLSYAPAQTQSNAFGALAAIAAGTETIELGILTDATVLAGVEALAGRHGNVTREAVPAEFGGGVSLTLALAPGENADLVLQALWTSGAEDAFVVKE